jgi:glycosyltransferase involved in cell wall biosynthesis
LSAADSVRLTVVIPCYNDASFLPRTLDALLEALDGSGFDADIVLVDDGSSDDTDTVARRVVGGRLPINVLSQPNRGRLAARRAGLAAAGGELVLLLDARVRLEPGALRFVRGRVKGGQHVWNGHVHVEDGNAFGTFWRLIAELAWRSYFDNPRTTSFGPADFDRYPKGTGCFLAPRTLLLKAFERFRTRYADARLANDDTPILRDLAAEERIGISPGFACSYTPRPTFGRFFRHSMRRGAVFLDGHGTPRSRFFPAVVLFFPLSAGLTAASVRRPLLAPAALAACGVASALYGAHARRSDDEIRALLFVTPVYAVGHALGMWRGAGELIRARLRT